MKDYKQRVRKIRRRQRRLHNYQAKLYDTLICIVGFFVVLLLLLNL